MKDILGVGKVIQFLNKNYERVFKKPLMTEIAPISKSTDAWSRFVGDIMFNPDRVLSSTHARGEGFDFYQKMLDTDPQLASCVRSRKKAVLNKPWEIVPASDKRRDHLIAEFVREAFNFRRQRESWYELMDVIPKGMSVSEIMWDGTDPNKVMIADLKGRNPNRFVFDVDGNLRLKTATNPWQGEELPPQKFIYMRNEPFAENPYGNAALKEVFWYYYGKKNAIKFWMMYMERFGSPHLKVTYPSGASDADKAMIETIINTWQNATGVKVPEGFVVEFLEAIRRGDAGYLSYIQYCDEQIAKSIHGQTLTSGEGRRVGSLALGEVHQETKYEYTADDCELLMDAMNHQLIPWLVDFNFAGVTDYPELVIHYEPDEDLTEAAKRDEIIFTKIGLPVGKKYLYDKYQVPEPEEEEELLEIPKKGGLPFSEQTKKKIFADRRKGYRIASTVKLRAKYQKEIQKLIESLQDGYLGIIESNQPLGVALEEFLRTKYNPKIASLLDKTQWDSIVAGAQSMADQLKLTVNRETFIGLMNNYVERRIYDMGTIEDMGNTLRDLLQGRVQELFDQKLDIPQVVSEIKKQFPELADWKAKQIAKTEISKAADWAGTQMVKESGLPVEAWFLVDPASCDECQEWASRNPYTMQQAEVMGLPHPNCDDQWAFTVKEK